MTAPEVDNIVLIGYRGSGKTTVGRLLAERLGWAFVDTDDLIESQADSAIADIFATEGEAGFRARERDIITRVTQHSEQVIAVGGGAVSDPENVERLKAAGTVIWLTASPRGLWQRIKQDRHSAATRPDLTPTGGLDEVRALLAHRQVAYRTAADLDIDTEHRDPATLATLIVAAVAKRRTS